MQLTQKVTMEQESFLATVELKNVLPDRAFENVRPVIIIEDSNDVKYTGKFTPVLITTMAETIGPGDSSTAVWRLTPKPGVAGTAAGGKAFYARVTVAITIDGHTKVVSTEWTAPFQVHPTPELVIRYGVPAMGNLLSPGDTFRVNVKITNQGTGAATNLVIDMPDIVFTGRDMAGGAHLVASSPQGAGIESVRFATIAAGDTVEGWWEFQADAMLRISNVTNSWMRQDSSHAAVQVGAPLKETLVGKYTQNDLIVALTALEQAVYAKIDADARRSSEFVGDAAATIQELDYIQAALALNSAVNMGLNIMSLVAGATSFVGNIGKALPASVISQINRAAGVIGLGMTGGGLLSDLILMYLNDKYGGGDEWADAVKGIIQKVSNPVPGQPPTNAETEFQKYVETQMPFYLVKDYLLWEDLQAVVTDDPMAALESLEAIIDRSDDFFTRIEGTIALKKMIQANFDQAKNFLGLTLPAYYPTDALHEEFTRLTSDLERAARSWGVAATDRQTGQPLRTPSSWYSVGEKGAIIDGEWVPVYLTNWEFGTSFEPAYILNMLIANQYFQFSLQWELVAMKWALTAMSGTMTAMGMLPGGSLGGMVGGMSATAANMEVDLAMYSIQGNITWGFEWIARRLGDLFKAEAVEGTGVWRMSSDIMHHLQYLEEMRPVDPPVPLTVEAIVTPDIVLSDGKLGDVQTAYITVTNDGDRPIQIMPVLQVYGGSEDFGRMDGQVATLQPGETKTLTANYSGIRSTLIDIHGYDVYVSLQVMDPGTMTHDIIGPYHSQFYAGSEDELALMRQQSLRYPLAGTINNAEQREYDLVPGPNTRRMRLLLTQPTEGDIDLHVYDLAGNHVGLNYDTSDTELEIPGANYAGSDAVYEWVWLDVPAGEQYHVVVEAVDVPLDALYHLAVLEVPEYAAMLDTIGGDIERTTNEDEIELAFSILEIGRQRDITGFAVMASDLTNGSGGTIPAANVTFDVSQTQIDAGGSADFIATVTVPGGTIDGTYTGMITVVGTDAVTGAPLELVMDVTLIMDTTAPDAPTLDTVTSPVTSGPATVTGTTTPGCSVELLLDGEHMAYAFPDDNGAFIHRDLSVPAGDHTITAVTRDDAGNVSVESTPVPVTSTVDLTPSTTTVTYSSDPSNTGWFDDHVSVSLLAADEAGGSGLAATYYSLDGGVQWRTYVDPIDFAEEGTALLWYYSQDNAGNTADVELVGIKVSKTPPVVLELTINDGLGVWSDVNSLMLSFSKPVNIESDALAMVNITTGQSVAIPAGVLFHYDSVAQTARWDLSGLSLHPSQYRVVIIAAEVTDVAGRSLDGDGNGAGGDDQEFSFLVTFAGDANLDGQVDAYDYIVCKRNIGTPSGATWSDGDSNGDGIVGWQDLLLLSANFGQTIALYLPPLPVVLDSTINDGLDIWSDVNSLMLSFSKPVNITADALVLENTTTGQSVAIPGVPLYYDPVAQTARWDLSSLDLPPSWYTATIIAAKVTDVAGQSLDGDGNGKGGDNQEFSFLVTFAGDANLDGRVDAFDYIVCKRNIGTPSGATWSDGDSNGDGVVGRQDLLLLSANFGHTIMSPALSPAVTEPQGTFLDEPGIAVASVGEQSEGDVGSSTQFKGATELSASLLEAAAAVLLDLSGSPETSSTAPQEKIADPMILNISAQPLQSTSLADADILGAAMPPGISTNTLDPDEVVSDLPAEEEYEADLGVPQLKVISMAELLPMAL